MQDFLTVTGIILKAQPIGESDRRITLLTNTHGKLGAFAGGARKPTSRFAATTIPFAFGRFKLYAGRDSYRLSDAEIENYFEEFREDVEGMAYASYFAEIADYYCRENGDEREMMKLFYQSLRALLAPQLPRRLIRPVYELKVLAVNGEYPGVPAGREILGGTRAALEHIGAAPPERLYTFVLSEEALGELSALAAEYRERYMEHRFKSLEILEALC